MYFYFSTLQCTSKSLNISLLSLQGSSRVDSTLLYNPVFVVPIALKSLPGKGRVEFPKLIMTPFRKSVFQAFEIAILFLPMSVSATSQ